jgi:hypothetical protein
MLPDALLSFRHHALFLLTIDLNLPQSTVPCPRLDTCPERPILVSEKSLFLKPLHRNQAIPILRVRPVLYELAAPPFSTNLLKELTKLRARPPMSNSPPQLTVWRVGFSSIPSWLAGRCVRYSPGQVVIGT